MSAIVEISIPDSLLKALGTAPAELPRKTLEALVVQSYRSGQITHAQVAEVLELDRWQTDAFLQKSHAHRPLEGEEFGADLAKLRTLGK